MKIHNPLRAMVWAAIRKFGEPEFRFSDIITAFPKYSDARLIRFYVSRLHKCGYLERMGHGVYSYRLIRDTGPIAPVPHADQVFDPNCDGSGTDTSLKIWLGIRVLKRFDAYEVAACAECGMSSSRVYLRRLERCGYVAMFSAGSPGKIKVYQLVRDTGSAAPIALPDGQMFDPNLSEFIAEVSEEQDGE